MRILALLPPALLLAACTTAPPQAARPGPVQPQPARPIGSLLGLTAEELTARLGQPGFQVREGPGLKLQWAVPSCILDAFLYPPATGGAARVTYIDTRRPTGDPADQLGCIAVLDRRR